MNPSFLSSRRRVLRRLACRALVGLRSDLIIIARRRAVECVLGWLLIWALGFTPVPVGQHRSPGVGELTLAIGAHLPYYVLHTLTVRRSCSSIERRPPLPLPRCVFKG
jgi:hypothetical protein